METPVKREIMELDDEGGDSEDLKMSESPMPNTPGDSSRQPSSSSTGPPAKRPRGRPRKHPITSPDAQAKITKGRSKTGCITCRRRKKKCDETKPHCLNCQKNAVVCEGYPERVVWKSGREKAEEARAARVGTQPRDLPELIDGVENEIDRLFLDYFIYELSPKLATATGQDNPFRNLLLPMALQHSGLMHSLLCLSGHHLSQLNPHAQVYSDRREYHYMVAIHKLRTDPKLDDQAHARSTELVDDPTVAQTLTLCLNSIHRGEKQGEYRLHLDAGRYHALHHKSPSHAFRHFLVDFFNYHDVINSITSLDRRPLLLTEDFQLPEFIVQPGAGTLLGVFDQLFGYLSKITRIRDTVRARKRQGIEPLVDYPTLGDAVRLDTEIRAWASPHPENTHKFIASQLYRQCTWIYLYRTIQPSRPTQKIIGAVDEGLSFLRQLPPDTNTQSILLMPLFLLGCAAFVPEQRPDIRRAFGTLKRYSNLGNIDPAREVVDKVWTRMDVKDGSSWDWETIIQEMGYDFLVS